MSPEPTRRRPNAAEPEAPAGDGAAGSGEGADTALEALIRKRRLQADPSLDPPEPPLPPAPVAP